MADTTRVMYVTEEGAGLATWHITGRPQVEDQVHLNYLPDGVWEVVAVQWTGNQQARCVWQARKDGALMTTMESLTAAVELHRPEYRDKYGRETSNVEDAKHIRCPECGQSVPMTGCRTWQTANGA